MRAYRRASLMLAVLALFGGCDRSSSESSVSDKPLSQEEIEQAWELAEADEWMEFCIASCRQSGCDFIDEMSPEEDCRRHCEDCDWDCTNDDLLSILPNDDGHPPYYFPQEVPPQTAWVRAGQCMTRFAAERPGTILHDVDAMAQCYNEYGCGAEDSSCLNHWFLIEVYKECAPIFDDYRNLCTSMLDVIDRCPQLLIHLEDDPTALDGDTCAMGLILNQMWSAFWDDSPFSCWTHTEDLAVDEQWLELFEKEAQLEADCIRSLACEQLPLGDDVDVSTLSETCAQTSTALETVHAEMDRLSAETCEDEDDDWYKNTLERDQPAFSIPNTIGSVMHLWGTKN